MPTPLRGDRSAWDTINYPELHAADIEDESYTYHLPAGGLPATVMQALFSVEGNLSVSDNPLRIYNVTGASKTISKVFLAVATAPATQAIIVDIHKDGTTIFTTQSNRPQIAASANTGQSTTIEVATWVDGSYLTMHVDQVGTGTVGANLTVHIVYS